MLHEYLLLEQLMREADERGDDTFGDNIRDCMDFAWHRLSFDEKAKLTNREAGQANE